MNKEFFQRMQERDQAQTPVNEVLKAKLARELALDRSPSWFKRLLGWIGSQARPLGGFALASALVLALSLGMSKTGSLPAIFHTGPQVDDWQYDSAATKLEKMMGLSVAQQSSGLASGGNSFQRAAPTMPTSMPSMAYESAADASLGFSAGGAKDINNFRENIKNGFLPIASDITYEGLFYDYSFDTGQRQACNELFCPSYARAIARNPVTNQDETYLSVGLNSNIKESDFKRPKTSFVMVLDISGSMDAPFDQYYYDEQGKRMEVPQAEANKTKMQLANESVAALVDHLNPDDRLGIVVFSDGASVAKPLGLVGDINKTTLKRHIMELKATNGTNMSAGLEQGMRLLACNDSIEVAAQCVHDGYEKRIIFITDAMPNQGEFGADGLHGLVERYTAERIQTTLIGVGVDFQTELVEALTKVRGANYLSIHSAQDFKQRLGEDFDFLVTPLVYDLRLDVKGSGYAIDEIYGSPDADLSSGEVMHVRTLFPSRTKNGETKGGLILLKLRKTGENPSLKLHATYEDTKGGKHSTEADVSFSNLSSGAFDNTGIRKGVLLVQYARLLKEWLRNEPQGAGWERTSKPLEVSGGYKTVFKQFQEEFLREMRSIGDNTLDQERVVLDKLIQAPDVMVQPIPSPVVNPPRPFLDDWMR